MACTPVSQNALHMENWRSTLNDEILKSPCTPIPIPGDTLIERILMALKTNADKFPEKKAVIEAQNQDHSLTYKQVHDRALAFAAFLTSRGFSVGDRVTAALPNSIEWPVLHLGTWVAGGAVVGSSAAFKLFETVYQLLDSASSVVVTSEHLLDIFIEGAKECPTVKTIICVRSSNKPLPQGVFDFEETLLCDPLNEIASVTPDDMSIIYYSSGTTGQPKGVVLTHRALHCEVEMLRSHWLHEIYPMLGAKEVDWHQESQLVSSACYHILGFSIVNLFLVTGSPMVLMAAFDGDVYLDVVEKFGPRFLIVGPPIFTYLAKEVKGKRDALASVKMILSASAPLSQELSNEFLARHPSVKYIVQGYGMTEMSSFSHVPLLEKEGVNASSGVVASYVEQKIVDPSTLLFCKQGQRGEVWMRGAIQTIGYLNKPEATRDTIDEEGWIHSGDIGYLDERGYLYIVDRLKDLIKVNFNNQSLQVPPAELEGILLSYSRIRDAAIVGIPDDKRGELVRAYVVRADEKLSEREVEELISDLNFPDKLAEFKHLTGGVVFVDEIPRSNIGKILRRVLRE
ncbi:hypothetical protein PENTCL1PPCAC_20415, partial [Pristionchus entomophagus]